MILYGMCKSSVSPSFPAVHGFLEASYTVIEEGGVGAELEEGRVDTEFKMNVKGETKIPILEEQGLLAGTIQSVAVTARTLLTYM